MLTEHKDIIASRMALSIHASGDTFRIAPDDLFTNKVLRLAVLASTHETQSTTSKNWMPFLLNRFTSGK